MSGNFQPAKALCDEFLEAHPTPNVLLDDPDSTNMDTSPTMILALASTRTGQAVTRLLLAETINDIFSVRDPFRMVIKLLEGFAPASSLAMVAAYLNAGIAEAVYADLLGRERRDAEVPLDAALRIWKQGLTLLQQRVRHRATKQPRESSATRYSSGVEQCLKARLQASMAWGLLELTRRSGAIGSSRDYLPDASEFAGKSLAVYDQNDKSNHPFVMGGRGRTLGLVAQCYHKSGAAVTAEGLYKSALDSFRVAPAKTGPLERLDERDVLLQYAALCQDWEKREGDARRLLTRADEIDSSLPGGWARRRKSGIQSSLWFWLPSQI
jgi:hypothetical protein